MQPTHLGTLVGLAVAAPVAWAVGGATGTGILGGFLLGAFAGLLGFALLRHALTHAPEDAIRAVVLGFALKLALLATAVAAFLLVPRLAEVAAPAAFLLSYAVAAVLLLGCGALQATRARAAADRAEGPPSDLLHGDTAS